MKLHYLKTWPKEFIQLWLGLKRFEFRKDDRGFEVGDQLCLMEWHSETGYTGRYVLSSITYILSSGYGMPGGYVVMSLSECLNRTSPQ